MESKTYTYKDITFKPAKKNLKFYRDNYHFIKTISAAALSDDKKSIDEEKFWNYIHTEENLKEILYRLLDGETDKIIIEVDNDDDYINLITLATEVLTDFFTNYNSIMKTKR